MPDRYDSDKWTDEQLARIEARLHRIYSAAVVEATARAEAFYSRLMQQDAAMRKRLESGEITQDAYETWLRRQMLTGKINEDMRDELAGQISDTNVLATEFINNQRPEIFAYNHNYAAYGLETTYGDLSFTLYDAATVRRLIVENPELLPEMSEALAVNIPVDIRWNKEKIVDVITSAILQGKSIPEIAGDMERVVGMNETSAVRNARTAVTSAQNAGRQASYEHAAAMGISVRKRWVATLDKRTRDSHRHMDGKEVPYDQPFHTDLGSTMMYPGDRNGKPGDVYNCRCTMRTVEKPEIEAEPRMRRVRDPATGKNVVVSAMTYSEWEKWKESQNTLRNAAGRVIIPVKKTETRAAANAVTEVTNKKGGRDRNFYDAAGEIYLQISNNGHGHKKEQGIGLHGEHAHDWKKTAGGEIIRGDARELTDTERKENGDFL